jgi:lambda family phage portal protein
MAVWDNLFKKRKRKRSYAAARPSRLFNDFRASSSDANSEIRYSLRTLRDKSRDLVRNNDYAKRYVQLLQTNVIGQNGIRLQSKARDADGSLDRFGNTLIEKTWEKWGKKGNCTLDGKLSFLDCQKLFIETLARDGEVLVRYVLSNDPENPFRIQFLDADYIDEEENKILDNDNQVIMGVHIDEHNRPKQYYLFKEHPHNQYFQTKNRQHTLVDANDVLHAFVADRAEQTRGVPFLSSAINRLKMLDGYEEAELVAARIAASKMGFFTSPAGDDYVGDDLDKEYTPISNAEPGTFEQLPDGMNFQTFDPQHPTSGFESFHKSVLRGVASGLGVSYVSLANNLEGVNYSSIRQGTLEERDNYRILQKFTIEHFIEPIFKRWLLQQMSFKKDFVLPSDKFDKFADNVIFVSRSWGWIDPVKEVKANVDGLNAGVVTMQDIQSNYGRDVEELMEQHARERDLADQYDIAFAYQPFGAQKMPIDAEVSGGDDVEGE